MANTTESNLRETVKTCETQIFSIRNEKIKYLTFRDGMLSPDPRFVNRVAELQAQEATLTKRITKIEAALDQAANIAAQFPGCNRTAPLTWLQDRSKALKKEIETLQIDIRACKTKIEQNAGTSSRPNIMTRAGQIKSVPEATQGWLDQVQVKENQLKEWQPQFEHVQKLISEIQPILQGCT